MKNKLHKLELVVIITMTAAVFWYSSWARAKLLENARLLAEIRQGINMIQGYPEALS